MPRYYFHFSDGNRVFADENGLELIDFADVKQRVIRQVRDLKSIPTMVCPLKSGPP